MAAADPLASRLPAIETMVARSAWNEALEAIHDAVEHVITDPFFMGQIYSSPRLDALCQIIGAHSFDALPKVDVARNERPTYIYIASKLQRSGGHTRLLRDFILARPDASHVILLTEIAGHSDHAWLAETFAPLAHYRCEVAPRGTLESTLRWLQTQLVALAPTHTYLFSHHQDPAAAAAIVPAMHLAASFCHHGDHHLCLGVHLTHLTHLDFHPMDFHHCRDMLHVSNNCYVPFTVPERTPRDASPFMANGVLTTCTAAGSNKLEQPYPAQYTEVIPALLATTGGTHIHIGKLSRRALTRIARGLAAHAIAPEKFIYIPWVESVWDTLLAQRVDYYLCSFPIGGGLTMIEAMGAGIPLAAHRHLITRALGGQDLTYEGAFSWRTAEELIAYCAALTPSKLAAQSALARAYFLQYHRRADLPKLLESPLASAPALTADYLPDRVGWERWFAAHSGGRYLVWLFAYRCFRRMRRRIGASMR